MKIEDAIAAGRKKSEGGKARRSQRRLNRPLTTTGLIGVFRDRFEMKGYGIPPLLTARDANMVKGFIKLCERNEKEPDEVYGWITDIVDNWSELQRMPTETLKGSVCNLPARPSLSHFLTCRDSILGNLSELKAEEPIESVPKEVKVALPGRTVLRAPTTQEVDDEYENF